MTWCTDAYDTAKGADILVVLTEWNTYRAMNLERLGKAMSGKLIIDMRNVYRLADMRGSGFRYVSVGRPTIEA